MSSYILNPDNVARIAIQTMHDLGQGDFDKVEICLGLAEALGRVIGDCSPTPVQGQELVKISVDHMAKVIQRAFEAKGFGHGSN